MPKFLPISVVTDDRVSSDLFHASYSTRKVRGSMMRHSQNGLSLNQTTFKLDDGRMTAKSFLYTEIF